MTAFQLHFDTGTFVEGDKLPGNPSVCRIVPCDGILVEPRTEQVIGDKLEMVLSIKLVLLGYLLGNTTGHTVCTLSTSNLTS